MTESGIYCLNSSLSLIFINIWKKPNLAQSTIDLVLSPVASLIRSIYSNATLESLKESFNP